MNADAWLVAASGCCAVAFAVLGLRGVAFAWAVAALAWGVVVLL